MTEIIMIGSDNSNGLYLMLNNLKEILDIDYNVYKLNHNIIKIIYNNNINRKYLIINIDFHEKTDLSKYKGYYVITVGFNKKSSITVSSVENDEVVFCIQREIDLINTAIEPQEIVVNNKFVLNKNILNSIFAFSAMFIIKEKDFENCF